MNAEELNKHAIVKLEPWTTRLIACTSLALVPIVVELWAHVFDSISVFFLAELALGGFGGRRFGALALGGALVAFLAWSGFELAVKHRTLHGEDVIPFLIGLAGAALFSMSALVMCFVSRKRKTDS